MTNNSFFVFFILCEILKIAYCGNEPFNLFGLQLNKETQEENPEFAKNPEKLQFEDDARVSEDKNLKKKRFFKDGESQTEIHPNRYFVNDEYSSKRRSSQGNPEDQQNVLENMQSYASNYWENERSKPPYSEEKENLGSSMEFRPREPMTSQSQRYDLEKGSLTEKSHSFWNGDNNFKFVNSNLDPRVGSSFRERVFNDNINDYSGVRDKNILDRRVSVTTLNEEEMRNMNRYRNDYRGNDMHSGYQMHSIMDFSKRRDDGFWNSNPYKHDKGVIINFNTDCPTFGKYNKAPMHRIVLSQKSPLTQSEISTYGFPGGLISSHQITPAYYL